MCPDRDLVSAYVDGEVPSPWRERLEEHLASCPNCAALAASYAALGERLRAEPSRTRPPRSRAAARGSDALLDGCRPTPTDGPARLRRDRSLRLAALGQPPPAPRRGGGPPRPPPRRGDAVLALRPTQGRRHPGSRLGRVRPARDAARLGPAGEHGRAPPLPRRPATARSRSRSSCRPSTTFGSAGKPVIMRSGQVRARRPTVGGSSP